MRVGLTPTGTGDSAAMDFARIRSFHAVVETGGVRQAAEQLHVSAASVSRAVKQLEHELGRSLFVQAGRGLELTADGRIAAQWAQGVLDQLARVEGLFLQQDEVAVRIGTFEFFMTQAMTLLADVVPTPFSVRDLAPDDLERALLEDVVDIGITVRPYPRDGVEHHPAGSFHMGVYARADRFSGLDALSTPFAIPLDPVADSPLFARAQDGWPDETYPRHALFHVDSLEGGLELCRSGRAAAFLPDFVVHLHNRNVVPGAQLQPVAWSLPRDAKQRYPAFVATRTDMTARAGVDKVARQLIDRLEALLAGVPDTLRHPYAED